MCVCVSVCLCVCVWGGASAGDWLLEEPKRFSPRGERESLPEIVLGASADKLKCVNLKNSKEMCDYFQ